MKCFGLFFIFMFLLFGCKNPLGDADSNTAFNPDSGIGGGTNSDSTAAEITSVNPSSSNGTYKLNENIEFLVSFDKAVIVMGTPRLPLTIGSTTRFASYFAGSGSSSVYFRYSVQSTDLDSDGIEFGGTVLDLNSGSVQSNEVDANLIFSSTGVDLSNYLVDGVAPTINTITPPSDSITTFGNSLTYQVVFSENVSVSGTPRIALTIGSTTQYADYASGDGTNTLSFSYTIQSSDIDLNGVLTTADVQLNSGSITDSALNDASTTTGAIDTSGVIITYTGHEIWTDAQDTSTLWQSSDCSSVQATAASDPIQCWTNKVNAANPLTYSGSAPTRTSDGVDFDHLDRLNFTGVIGKEIFLVLSNAGATSNGSAFVNPVLGDSGPVAGHYSYIFINMNPGYDLSLDGGSGVMDSGYYSMNGNTQLGPGGNLGTGPYPSDASKRIIGMSFVTTPNPWASLGYLNNGTAFYANVDVHELLIFSGNLGSSERQVIEGYLACKWSLQGDLPGLHPFKSSCPF